MSYYWQETVRELDRHIAALERMHKRAKKRNPFSVESEALWSAIYDMKRDREKRREYIAKDCAPWFESQSAAEGASNG